MCVYKHIYSLCAVRCVYKHIYSLCAFRCVYKHIYSLCAVTCVYKHICSLCAVISVYKYIYSLCAVISVYKHIYSLCAVISVYKHIYSLCAVISVYKHTFFTIQGRWSGNKNKKNWNCSECRVPRKPSLGPFWARVSEVRQSCTKLPPIFISVGVTEFSLGRLSGVPIGGGFGGPTLPPPPTPRNSQVLTKLSRIPSSVENTSVTT
jgi:hypothetical protein